MILTHEYIRHRSGYAFGAGCCWIRIYRGDPEDAPVVICEEVPGSGASVLEMSSQLAAEVIRDHFAGALPDLPRPLLWIERLSSRRGRGERYFLVTFSTYTPRPEAPGFVRRVTLGPAEREPLLPREVGVLIGGAPLR